MTPDANERWTQRILDGLGARPVGHAEPLDDESGPELGDTAVMAAGAIGGQFPLWTRRRTASPAPDAQPSTAPSAEPASQPAAARIGGGRLPDWRALVKPPVGQEPDGPQVPIQPTPAPPQPTVPPSKEPEPPGPVPTESVRKAAGPAVIPTAKGPVDRITIVAKAAKDPNTRIAVFNLTAGLVGGAFGLVSYVAEVLPVAEDGAVGIFGLVLAGAGGYLTWKASGLGIFQSIYNVLPHARVIRMVGTLGAAGAAREFAPVPVDLLNAYGQEWGFGPDAISLLITEASICGGLWYLIDRKLRGKHWVIRWIARIPLASALLATALNTTDAVT